MLPRMDTASILLLYLRGGENWRLPGATVIPMALVVVSTLLRES